MLHTVNVVTEYLMKNNSELFDSAKAGNMNAIAEVRGLIKVILKEHVGSEFFKQKKYNEDMFKILSKEIYDEIFNHGPLTDLMADRENKSDLHFNIYEVTYRDKANKIIDSNVRFLNEQHMEKHINRLLEPIGETLSRTNKKVDAVLPDGTRVHAHHPICTSCGYDVRLRFHLEEIPTLEDNVAYGMLDEKMARFIRVCAQYGLNLHVFGPQGSGKTTFIGTYIISHPLDEYGKSVHNHVLIADQQELFIKRKHPNIRILELHEHKKGDNPYTVYDAVLDSLRTDSDRVHFNEVRGAEFSDYLYSSSKNDGGVSGGHSNSMEGAYQAGLDAQKLADPNITDEMAGRRLVKGLDVFVQFSKVGEKRKIVNISMLVGNVGVKPVFEQLFKYNKKNDDFVYFNDAKVPQKIDDKLSSSGKSLHELIAS
jgi:pilus assembly protein CpaF